MICCVLLAVILLQNVSLLAGVYGEAVGVHERVRECESNEFKCSSGHCIYKGFICDKEWDCSDGSDEEKCDQCGNTVSGLCLNDGKCVPTGESFTCLCHPHTTGALCETLLPCEDTFRCSDGRCKPFSFVCDGDDDCGDRSDEQNCYLCGDTHSGRCQNAGKCVPNGKTIRCLCDSRYTGELCETALPCTDREYTCRNGRCINDRYKCDGDNDCGDESDEDICGRSKQRIRKYELKKRLFGLF